MDDHLLAGYSLMEAFLEQAEYLSLEELSDFCDAHDLPSQVRETLYRRREVNQ